jgi:hypothetical protein
VNTGLLGHNEDDDSPPSEAPDPGLVSSLGELIEPEVRRHSLRFAINSGSVAVASK